jgi:hypothetical protein
MLACLNATPSPIPGVQTAVVPVLVQALADVAQLRSRGGLSAGERSSRGLSGVALSFIVFITLLPFFQFANNYEHQAELPEQFSPMKNVFINYYITGMEWSEE